MGSIVRRAAGLQRFMLDCGFWRSRNWRRMGLAEIGLQAAGVSYSYEHLTDGILPGPDPEDLAVALGLRTKGLAAALAKLIEAGLWAREGDDFRIVGYADHNPSAEEVQKRRADMAERSMRGIHARWHTEQPDPSCPLCQPGTQQAMPMGIPEGMPQGIPARNALKAEQSRAERPPPTSSMPHTAPSTNGAVADAPAEEEDPTILEEAQRRAHATLERLTAEGHPPNNRHAWLKTTIANELELLRDEHAQRAANAAADLAERTAQATNMGATCADQRGLRLIQQGRDLYGQRRDLRLIFIRSARAARKAAA